MWRHRSHAPTKRVSRRTERLRLLPRVPFVRLMIFPLDWAKCSSADARAFRHGCARLLEESVCGQAGFAQKLDGFEVRCPMQRCAMHFTKRRNARILRARRRRTPAQSSNLADAFRVEQVR